MLYSARSKEFMTEEGLNKALTTCKMLGLDALVGIGGDGTFRGLLSLAKNGISVIGIPGTVTRKGILPTQRRSSSESWLRVQRIAFLALG